MNTIPDRIQKRLIFSSPLIFEFSQEPILKKMQRNYQYKKIIIFVHHWASEISEKNRGDEKVLINSIMQFLEDFLRISTFSNYLTGSVVKLDIGYL